MLLKGIKFNFNILNFLQRKKKKTHIFIYNKCLYFFKRFMPNLSKNFIKAVKAILYHLIFYAYMPARIALVGGLKPPQYNKRIY